MDESSETVTESRWSIYAARLTHYAISVCKFVCAAMGVMATAVLVRLVLSRHPVGIHWSIQVLLAVVVLLASGLMILRQRRHWSGPTRHLASLVELIHAGEAPIEELSGIRGGPAILVPGLREVFKDLKSQRAAVAQLHQEIRQRVANRTDALERAVGSLRQQANRDALTGLYNRRALDQYMPSIVEKAVLAGGDLCVLMIDVDHFKPLNDTLGHAAGDELLKTIGDLIRSTVRDHDFAFRHGGDEFIILMTGSDRRAGQALAQRLTSLVDGLVKPMRLAQSPRLSIGVASLADLAEGVAATPETLLKEADKCLYAIKGQRHGRRGNGVAA